MCCLIVIAYTFGISTFSAIWLSHKIDRLQPLVQFTFYFWSFEISVNILRNQKYIIGLDSYSRQVSNKYGPHFDLPGAVARSEASSLGMQAAPSSIPTSGTFFRGDLVMKTFLWPFSLFRWFKKSSCQLLAKECALSTGKLPRRLAQEQCG